MRINRKLKVVLMRSAFCRGVTVASKASNKEYDAVPDVKNTE